MKGIIIFLLAVFATSSISNGQNIYPFGNFFPISNFANTANQAIGNVVDGTGLRTLGNVAEGTFNRLTDGSTVKRIGETASRTVGNVVNKAVDGVHRLLSATDLSFFDPNRSLDSYWDGYLVSEMEFFRMSKKIVYAFFNTVRHKNSCSIILFE